MEDVLAANDRGLRFVYGRPEVVEAEIDRLKNDYVVTGFYYYVVSDHLEVCAQLVHQREIKKAQLGAIAMPRGGLRQ